MSLEKGLHQANVSAGQQWIHAEQTQLYHSGEKTITPKWDFITPLTSSILFWPYLYAASQLRRRKPGLHCHGEDKRK